MNSRNKSRFWRNIVNATTGSRRLAALTHCFNGDIFRRLRRMGIFCQCLALAASWAGAAGAATGVELGKALEQGLRNGTAVWLEDGEGKYFTVFNRDRSGQPKGGVIILHDANSHPDSPRVIRPLRQWLPLQGWATIAIQLPALEQPADYLKKQAIIEKRINGAANYLRNNGFDNLILLGHGTGAMAATQFLSQQSNEFLRAFVGISLGVLHGQAEEDTIPSQLEKINLPILDIYAGSDLDHVTKSAKQRALAAKVSSDAATRRNQLERYKRSAIAKSSTQNSQGYISFRQIKIDGAGHDFSGAERLLARRIIGWLERHAKGVAVNR